VAGMLFCLLVCTQSIKYWVSIVYVYRLIVSCFGLLCLYIVYELKYPALLGIQDKVK
jgi:hypothetical protein